MDTLTLEHILEAKELLADNIKRTPLTRSATFSKLTGLEVYIKYENLQKAGSLKIRGAYNRIAHLDEKQREKGVVAVSTGNHAQGVALAASMFNISSTIVMPKGAPLPKIQATEGYGGRIILHGENFEEAYEKAKDIEKLEGKTLIHAFNDLFIVAGQGTIGLEILEDCPDVNLVVAPIGGGGLISGIGTAIKSKRTGCRVIGVQSKEIDSVHRAFKNNLETKLKKGYTIADGIAVKSPSEFTLSIIRSVVDDVVTVEEEEIARAILLLLERCKTVAEGAGAVSLAALLHRNIAQKGEKVVLVISGGNIDITLLGKIITQGLTKAGRYQEVKVLVEDRTSALESLLRTLSELETNIMDMAIDRYSTDVPFDKVVVFLALETKGAKHSKSILKELEKTYVLV